MENSMPDSYNEQEVILEFGHVPNSPNYSRAVELAQSMGSYRQEGEGSQLRHYVSLVESEGEKWITLYCIVQAWKSSRVSRGNLSNLPKGNEWTFRCYLERCRASDKAAHCFKDNWVGCQKVTAGHLLLLDYDSGRFVGKEEFEPDKEAIKQRIKRNLDRYGLCPAFSLTRINEQVDGLPATIKLADNANWKPIVESEYSTGILRFSGISYKSEPEITKGPVVEDIDEVEEYSVRHFELALSDKQEWEHKILILEHNQWLDGARSGTVPEIADLGRKGWQLLTVIHIEGEWHCIFQRRRLLSS